MIPNFSTNCKEIQSNYGFLCAIYTKCIIFLDFILSWRDLFGIIPIICVRDTPTCSCYHYFLSHTACGLSFLREYMRCLSVSCTRFSPIFLFPRIYTTFLYSTYPLPFIFLISRVYALVSLHSYPRKQQKLSYEFS